MAGNSFVADVGVGRIAAPGPTRTSRICFVFVLVEFVGCYECMDLICCPVRFSIGDSIGKRDIKWD